MPYRGRERGRQFFFTKNRGDTSVSASGDTNPSDDATATGDCMLISADDFDRAMLLLLLKSVEVSK